MGCSMKECKKCKVIVLDNSPICPLCKKVLAGEELEGSSKREASYPEVDFDLHKYNIIIRAFLFISLVIAIGLGIINYLTYTGVIWSIIAVASILYFWLTITYSVIHSTNLASKILVQTIGAQVLTVIIDHVIGYQGWSVDFAIPGIIIMANLAILVLMTVNRMSWQSYFVYQIAIFVFSLIPVILFWQKVIKHPTLTFIASGLSLFILVGTIIFGDKNVKNELIRRFHS